MRHWHEVEDEFLMVARRRIDPGRGRGEVLMRPGDCAAFKAGVQTAIAW